MTVGNPSFAKPTRMAAGTVASLPAGVLGSRKHWRTSRRWHPASQVRGPSSLAAGLLAGLALGLASPASAQLPGQPTPAPAAAAAAVDEPSREQVDQRRGEIRGRLAETRSRAAVADPEEAAILGRQVETLEGLDRLLALQLGELRRTEETDGDAGREAELLATGLDTRIGHPPPYKVAELDAVLDDLVAAVATREVSAQAEGESSRQVERAREQLAEREKEELLARDEAPTPAQALRLELLTLQVEAAREQLTLRRLEHRDAGRDLEIQQARERRLQQLAREARARLQPTAGELQSILAEVEARTRQLDESLGAAREPIRVAEEQLMAARERVELAVGQPGPALVARAEAMRLALAAAELCEELLQRQRQRAQDLADLWRLRFDLFADAIRPRDVVRRRTEREGELEELDRMRSLTQARLDERRLLAATLGQRPAGQQEDPGESRWLDEQRRHLQQMIELHEGELADLDRSARLVGRVRDELAERAGGIGVGERLGVLWGDVADVWSYEILEAEGEPITVAKVVRALLLILVGVLFSKWLSRRLARLLLPRLGLTKGAAVAVQTLVYYALLAIFVLWALQVVKIPLTVFTFLGGVLAIGIGFGSQNIMNNFISGLIILAEHPIKVGDLVDVDGIYGQVESIGPRSSRIRAGDNTHVIVPNSAFLEKNVLNWTVSDDLLRTQVDVGVAYGSPVEEVARLLEQAMAEEPAILGKPAPEVLFMDFGDNALTFRALFWVQVQRPLDRTRAQSRLRFKIDRILHAAGIVIAFPQRDVHLDSLSPLEVRMVGEPQPARGPYGEAPP